VKNENSDTGKQHKNSTKHNKKAIALGLLCPSITQMDEKEKKCLTKHRITVKFIKVNPDLSFVLIFNVTYIKKVTFSCRHYIQSFSKHYFEPIKILFQITYMF
jgi:hypothetical protein